MRSLLSLPLLFRLIECMGYELPKYPPPPLLWSSSLFSAVLLSAAGSSQGVILEETGVAMLGVREALADATRVVAGPKMRSSWL